MKKIYHFTLIILLAMVWSGPVYGQSQKPDSQGKEFWLAFPANFGSATLTLFISGGQATTGTVEVPGLGFTQTFSVTPGLVTSVTLPANAAIGSINGIENKGIHVTSQEEVTIYGLNRQAFTTDAYLGLPVDILGQEYLTMGYRRGFSGGEYFTIVAPENNTTVTITPKIAASGRPAGVPFSIVLNEGEVYQLKAGGATSTLTGSSIVSDKPVAVFGGNACANVPPNVGACDHLVEQLFPVDTWGQNFLTVPLKSRNGGDTFIVLASENGTTVQVTGRAPIALNRGELSEFILTSRSSITADKPVLVAQFSNGQGFDNVNADPFMMLVSPFEQYEASYTVTTPGSGFSRNFINIISPNSGIGSITLNGTAVNPALFLPIPNSSFSGAQIDVSLGTTNLEGSEPFGVFAYGFDNFDSYGYPGGTTLAPIALISNLDVTPNNGDVVQGDECCLTARVTDQFGDPLEGIRVDLTVSGANNTSTFGNTDANGEVVLCYTTVEFGTDNLLVTTGSLSETLSKEIIDRCLNETEPPVIECPDPVVVSAGANCEGMVPDLLAGLVVTDNCSDPGDIALTQTPAVGTVFSGSVTVTITATDEEGNSDTCVVDVSAEDTTPPELICPGDLTVSQDPTLCDGIVPDIASLATATDNCSAVVISQSPAIGSLIPLGVTVVTITAIDDAGLQSVCNVNLTVVDDTPPALTCPTDAVPVPVDANCEGFAPSVINLVTADDCSAFGASQDIPPGTPLALGQHTIIVTVTDIQGLSSECAVLVDVFDDVPPTIDQLPDETVSTDDGVCGAVYEYDVSVGSGGGILDQATPTITLNGQGGFTNMNVAYNPNLDLYYFSRGGNSSLPIETFDGQGNLLLRTPNSGHDWRGMWWNPIDNQLEGNPCSSCPSNGIRRQDLDANGYALGTGTNILPVGQPDFQSKGDYDYDANEIIYYNQGVIHRYSHVNGAALGSYSLSLPVPQGDIQPYFVGYTGIPGQEVVIYDQAQEHVLFFNKADGSYQGRSVLPANAAQINPFWGIGYTNGQIFIATGSGNQAFGYQVIGGGGVVGDNCPVTLTQTEGLPSGAVFPVGTTTNTFVAEDPSGNTATMSFNVTVIDDEAPQVTSQDITVTLTASGTVTIAAQDVLDTGSDNCSPITYSLDRDTFDGQDAVNSPVTVQLTGTDPSNNATTVPALVTVLDPVPEVITQDITVYLDGSGQVEIAPEDVDNGSNSVVGIAELSLDITTFSCANIGVNTVVLTATSTLGNSASAPAEVTVIDDQAPEIFPPGSFTETGSGPDCGINIVLPNPDIVENCAVTELSVYVNGDEAFDYVFVPQDGNIEQPRQVIFGPDGHLYVSNLVVVGPGDFEGQVLKYDGVTGDFIMEIGGPSGSTSIAFPRGIDFGPDGNLYVASQNSGEVLRLDPNTGGLIDIFVPAGTGGLGQPTGIVFGPDGHLYVADRTSASVRKFDGNTGASQGEFVTGGSGGLAFPIGITFGPDGNFYSTSLASNSINRYDGGSGAFIDEFVPSGSQGLDLPEDLEFGPDGNLYVSSFNGLVSKYDGQSGAFLEDISATGIDLPNAEGLTFGPDGHLYVSNLGRGQIVRYPLGPIHIPFGTNDITINATDNSGNGASANYTIDVIDDLPPVVECQDITVVLDENGTAFVPAEDLTARTNLTSDNWLGFIGIILNGNFSGGDVVAIEDIKSNVDAENDMITLQPNFDPSYPENFDNPELQGSTYIETYGDLAGKAFEFTGHVVSNSLAGQYNGFAFIRLFDANFGFLGEISSPLVAGDDFSVAYDNSMPDAWIIQYGFTVQGPSGAFEDEASLGEAVVQGMRLRLPPYDNCTIASIESTQTEFDCSHAGENIVTLTVTDVNGNATSCDATVTIVDKTPPVAVCQDITIQLDASGNAFITPDDIDNGSSDACGIDFIELDRDAFGCNNVGQNQVTLTVTDIFGNSSSCTAIVTVEDVTAPELIAPDPLVLTGSGLDCGASLILPTPEVIESCGLSSAELLANGETLFDYTFVPADGTLEQPRQLIFGPDGNLYVGDLTFGPNGQEGRIMKFDGTTGATLLEIGGPSGSTSLAYPRGLDFGPDGNLYVSSSSSGEVLRFDPNTGALIDTFVPAGTGGLTAPTGLVFGPDGDLYVVDRVGSVVRKYDATTGAYLGDFVAPGAGGMVFPIGLTFGPDGNLYVASFFTNAVHRFDGTTGAFIDQFVPSGSGGLQGPEDVEFGPDGDLYVTSFSTGQLFKYDGSTGAFLQDITATGIGLFFPDGLTFGPDGHLYASNTGGDQIVRYPLGELDLPYGVNDITFNVADQSGNPASITYTIEVEDDVPPVFDPVSDLLMPTFEKSDGRIVEYDLPTATDNCDLAGPPTLISGIGSGGFFPIGTTTEVYEVTDINGNVSTTSFVVTVTTDLGIVNFDLVCTDKKDKYANEDKDDYGKHKDKDDKCDGNVIRPLKDGDVIDAADPATSSISIVANVSRKAGSVAFYLDGELVRIDNYKDYSITGNKKDIYEFNPSLGTHTLTAIPYSKKDGEGDEGIPLTITFTVINTSAVTSFNLFETDKDGQTLPMTDGQVIDVAGGYEFTIEAVTDPAEVGSVLFLLNGEKVSIDNDNIYLLENPKKGKDDDDDDDYGKHKDDKREKAKPFDWAAGDYTLTAIPFEDEDMCGTSGTSATITFTIVNSEAVTSFAIVDEKKKKKDEDEVLIPLEDGDIVDIDDLRSKYRAIQAFTNPDEVGSVVFYLDGEEVDTDYKAPYLTDVFEKLKCKDSKKDAAKHKGDKYDLSCILGEHTLTAVPYSQKKGEGVAGTALTITFEVVQSTSTREELDSEELAELQVDAIQSVVYPNPVVDKVSLSILSPMEDGAELAVIDLSGKVLHKQALELRRGNNEVELDLVELNVSVGTVLIKVSTHQQGTMTHRLMKQ